MPQTLQVLRQYVLHLLFAPPAPALGLSGDSAAPAKNPFPFQQKPNTLDRDQIVVPAGWDSWNKITVLREGFEAKIWGEAWERDLEQAEGEAETEPGARAMYSALVPDEGVKVLTFPSIYSRLQTDQEQFLSHHHYLLSTVRQQNKHSWQRITTRIPRNQTAILVVHSRIPSKAQPLVLWVLWEAAASTCRTSSVP